MSAASFTTTTTSHDEGATFAYFAPRGADPLPVLRFRWNGSLTVNVYVGGDESDVFTFSERPTHAEVVATCDAYYRDAVNGGDR